MTTESFLKANYGCRPMSVAPFSINGGSVDEGGVASTFLNDAKRQRVDTDEEVAAALASVGAYIEPTSSSWRDISEPFDMMADDRTMTPSSSLASLSPAPSTPNQITPSKSVSTGSSVGSTTSKGKAPMGAPRGRDIHGGLPATPDPIVPQMMLLAQMNEARATEQAARTDKLMEMVIAIISHPQNRD